MSDSGISSFFSSFLGRPSQPGDAQNQSGSEVPADVQASASSESDRLEQPVRSALQINRNVSRRPRRSFAHYVNLAHLFDGVPVEPDIPNIDSFFSVSVNRPLFSIMPPPRLIGTDTLPKLNVRAQDMKRELDRVFGKYENFFALNGLADNATVPTSDDNATLMASIFRQYLGDDALDAIHPIGIDRTKTYAEVKTALIAKFKPSYSEFHLRTQFMRCTMLDGQTSRDFLQVLWDAIRRTSCADPDEQLHWVLSCFMTRHVNEEVRKVFELKAPKTEEEALAIVDDVESKQRERSNNAKIQAVLQSSAEAGPSDVSAVNARSRDTGFNNRNNGGRGRDRGSRGRGGNQFHNVSADDCRNCGRSPRCAPGQCPAANQNCLECGRRGHFGRVCFERKRRLGVGGGQRNASGQFSRRSTNECDAAGSGFADQADHRRFLDEQQSAAPFYASQSEVGYFPHSPFGPPLAPSFADVHHEQMEYLRQLSTRASSHTPQRVPKAGPSSRISGLQFEPTSMDISEVSTQHSVRASAIPDVWFENLAINSRVLRAKIDTGARVNVMSQAQFRAFGLPESVLSPSPVVLVSFDQAVIRPIGMFTRRVTVNGVSLPMTFHVVPQCGHILISYRDAVRARLLHHDMYAVDTFDFDDAHVHELSVYKGEIYKLVLREDAVPRSFPARKVPLALDAEVKEELNRMEREGVITRVNEPTDWCSPMLVRRKPNGLLRVCMDPRYLNAFLKRATYPLPDVEQVFTQFRGARFFSKMDLTMGFWQVMLDEVSSYLCTFSTPYGRYRYLRLPFGISPAPEVFHRIVADVIRDIPGVLHFVDDILVWGNTKEEHDERLKTVLDRFAAVNFTFNPAKCTFGKPEVDFLGHKVNGETIRPDPRKVESIKNFPVPRSVDEVRRLLGVATYISKFIPRFSAKTAILRQLLKADTVFEWTDQHSQALQAIKDELLSEKFLYIFDPRLPVQIATDACSSGLGAVLLQNDRPIAFAARGLTPAECNYSVIEKELLAVVFALHRFNFYTAGRRVTVLTDHQPLLGAARNVLLRDNPRLDRLFDRIISYDLTWTYVPGKQNFFPDFLSRLPAECMPPSSCFTGSLDDVPVATGPTYEALRDASSNDEVVRFVRECLHSDWPRARAACPAFAKFLWHDRDAYRIVDGVLVDKNDRVYVPAAARRAVLNELHLGHPGASSMFRRANLCFFWPTMRPDVDSHVSQCVTCAMHVPRQAREPLLYRSMPSCPGDTISADFFQIGSSSYLAMYDVFSQFPFLWPVTHATAHALIRACRVFFQFSGCPQHWWSDRGGAFDSAEFRLFAQSIGMTLHYSSAEYPQSNGSAESAVKILKRLKQVCANESDLFRATLYLQNTAKKAHTLSPAQVFLGRSIRTPLHPQPRQSLVPWSVHFRERITDQRASREPARAPPPVRDFVPGESVLVHNVRGAKLPATIVQAGSEPRSYLVEFPSGTRSIRNRIFLTPLPRSPPRSVGNESPPTKTTTASPPATTGPACPQAVTTDPAGPRLQSSTPSPSPLLVKVPRLPPPSRPLVNEPLPAPVPSSNVPEPPTPPLVLPPPSSRRPRGRPSARERPPPPLVTTRAGRPIRLTWKLRDR